MEKLRYHLYQLLRWSEKYTKTDIVYLTKGGFWSGFSTVISMTSSFILTILFANFLSPHDYGIYKYIFSVYGILGAFSFSSLDILIIQAVSKGYDGVIKKAFAYSLKWNIPYAVISFSIAGYYYLNSNVQLATAFFFIAILAPILTSYGVFGSFLIGKKDFRLNSIANSISNIFTSVFILLAIILTQNPVIIVFVYFVAHTIMAALFYYYTIKKYKPQNTFEKQSLAKGIHFSLMNILTIIGSHIDKIMIFHFLGSGQLALYSFALAPVNQIQGLLKTSGPLYSPKILSKTKAENKRDLPKKFLHIATLMVVPVIVYIFLAPYFYKLFFPQYTGAIIYSQFYALILILFGKKFIGISTAIHLPKSTLYKISVLNATVTIVPKLSLIYFWGLPGAIAGELTSNILLTVVSYYYFKRM